MLRDEVEIPQSSSRHHRLFSSAAPLLLYTLCVATGRNSVDEERHRSCVFVFDKLQKMTKESFASLERDKNRILTTVLVCVCVCRSDEEMVKFMQLMNSIWNICGQDVVTAFDLSPFKTICDLGGKSVCVCVC